MGCDKSRRTAYKKILQKGVRFYARFEYATMGKIPADD